MDLTNEKDLEDVTFHALVFDDADSWERTRETLLRFLNSIDGRQFVSRARRPIAVLGSDRRRGAPYYLHLSDGALDVLRELEMPFSVFTSAFVHELPSNQVVHFYA